MWRAREKREPLVVCLHVNVVPRLIDHIYVLVCEFVCACVSKWVSTLKYLAPPFCNLNETIMSIMYQVSCNDMLLHVISFSDSLDTLSNVWLTGGVYLKGLLLVISHCDLS